MAAVQDPIDRDLMKIPHYFADKSHDSMRIEHWVARIDRLRATHGWTSLQTVGHALNALRGKAIDSTSFFKHADERCLVDWDVYKNLILSHYGTMTRDTSSIANLVVKQAPQESVAAFTDRVAVVVDEFYIKAQDDMSDFTDINIWLNDANARACPLQAAQMVVEANLPTVLAILKWSAKFNFHRAKDYTAITMFINGLHTNIRTIVQQTEPRSWFRARTEAIKAEKMVNGPENKTLGLEQPSRSTTSINAIYRGRGGRGRGNYSNRGNGRGTGKLTYPSDRTCYYCGIKGHVQKTCRKRITRNAKTVVTPRSVAEITQDEIDFQDEDLYEGESQHDDYLTHSLAPIESEEQPEEYDDEAYVSALQINAIHLN